MDYWLGADTFTPAQTQVDTAFLNYTQIGELYGPDAFNMAPRILLKGTKVACPEEKPCTYKGA